MQQISSTAEESIAAESNAAETMQISSNAEEIITAQSNAVITELL